jgi:antitoxin (DNA-binding transcriptional repressor) of toxin-antitoxin stability system
MAWRRIVNYKVGSYEAKTKLPAMLRGVQVGNRYTITLRGEPIADLVPAQGNKAVDAAVAVEQMLEFMRAAPVVGVKIKELVDEGRA